MPSLKIHSIWTIAGIFFMSCFLITVTSDASPSSKDNQVLAPSPERLDNTLVILEAQVAELENTGLQFLSVVNVITKFASDAFSAAEDAKKSIKIFKDYEKYVTDTLYPGCQNIQKYLNSIGDSAEKAKEEADKANKLFKEIDTRLSRCASPDDLNWSDAILQEAKALTRSADQKYQSADNKRKVLISGPVFVDTKRKAEKTKEYIEASYVSCQRDMREVYQVGYFTEGWAKDIRNLPNKFSRQSDTLLRSISNLREISPAAYQSRLNALQSRVSHYSKNFYDSQMERIDSHLRRAQQAKSVVRDWGGEKEKGRLDDMLLFCGNLTTEGIVHEQLEKASHSVYEAGDFDRRLSGISEKRKKCSQKLAQTGTASQPPPAGSGIKVVAGTYGGNCRQPRGNKTEHLAKACNGRSQCVYTVDHKVIGDPAYGCVKNYVAEWQCGSSPAVLRAEAPGEAGYGSKVTLSCVTTPTRPVAPSPSETGGMEQGVDMPGADYRNFDLPKADPALCMNACMSDPACKAWTYVKPGFQGPNPRCWLKNAIPNRVQNTCCVSGVKGGGPSVVVPKYLGCFKDQGDPSGTSGRDLSGAVWQDGKMTIESCNAYCGQRNFAYAGVQYSTWCFCGNSYGKSGQANNCDMKCGGNPNEFCGGSWANSIYSTGVKGGGGGVGPGGDSGSSGVGGGGGICADPRTLPIMDEWLSRAIPPQKPGESLRSEPWGRLVGTSLPATIRTAGPPDTRETRCEWLWHYSAGLTSTNGLGTLREYVNQRLR